jgi:apolipoprotein N-acyltransferase
MRAVGRIAVALAAAPLLAVAQSPIAIAPVALVALAPLLWASRRGSAREALVLGALVGTLYGCLVAPWIPEALRSLGSSHSTALLGLVVTAAWAKVPLFGAIALAAHSLRSRSGSLQIAGLALAVGVCEWGIGFWHLGVPWALLGHSQVEMSGVAQLALVGGVPLLSAWLAGVNASIAVAVDGHRGARRLAAALGASWLAMAFLGTPTAEWARPAPAEGSQLVLLVVQPEIPRYARWEPGAQSWVLQTVAEHTSAALSEAPGRVDAVLWPENVLTTPLEREPGLASALQGHVDAWNVPLITGLVRAPEAETSDAYRNSVVWLEPGRGTVAVMDKFRAIPLLEASLPLFAERLLAPLFGEAARWRKVEEAATPGAPPALGFSGVPVLCYEALFPDIVAARRSPGSVAILNLADDSWVSGDAATIQLTDFARFRAIEQRLPLIRVAHGGLSVVVDPFGRIVNRLPLDAFASEVVVVEQQAPPRLAEKAALLALPVTVGSGVWWLLGALGLGAQPRRRP